jgi:putative methyltransferase (TIGR04325 family)
LLNSRFLTRLFRPQWQGVYQSFSEAQAAIAGRSGHVEANRPDFLVSAIGVVRESDYAAFFHLRDKIVPGVRFFDYGGNCGLAYYAFERLMNVPTDSCWTTCDVPEVAKLGQRLAAEKNIRNLHFTSDLSECEDFDILHTAGTLQFVEKPFEELRGLKSKPRHLLVNRVPVWERPQIYTRNNVTADGLLVASCPYCIYNRQNLISLVESLGYRLGDSWPCWESTWHLRLRPEYRLRAYSGFYFVLAE